MQTESVNDRGVPPSVADGMGLARSERLQLLFDAISDMVVLIRREHGGVYRCLEANQAVARTEGIPLDAILGKRVDEIHPPEVYAKWKAIYDKVIETGEPLEVEHDVMSPLGARNRITRLIPVPGDGGGNRLLMSVSRDVTEAKSAALERDAHLRHLEAINRIGIILSEDMDLEYMLQRITGALLDIFSTDRAWIAAPCDPDAPCWELKVISAREGFPGVPLRTSVPMDGVTREIVREVAANDGPLAFDKSHPMPGGAAFHQRFGIRSQLMMALRLKGGETWCVGLHQCTHERAWTPADASLFRDIVLRIKDSLENLLLHLDLKKSRELYLLMTNALPQLLWRSSPDGNLEYVNRRWVEYTGLSLEETRAGDGLGAIHPEDVERCLDYWRRTREEDEPFEVELRYRRKDGTYLWHLTRAFPIQEADGSITAWVGTCTDISEAKRVQEEAARSRTELDIILQGMDEGISAQDPTGRIIYANQKFAETSGFPDTSTFLASALEERKGRYELFDESGRALTWAELPGHRALNGEDHVQAILRSRDCKLGVERWINAKSTSVRDAEGKIVMAINFSQDITAMREAREQLLKSRTQLSTILSGISESIIAYDCSGRIVYANDVAAKILDQPSADALIRLTSAPPADTAPPEYHLFDEFGKPLPQDAFPFKVALAGKECPPQVLRIRLGAKGKERWILARAKPIFDDEGKVAMAISMSQDITELREKDEAMKRLQKMESLGKLAGGIAHDFNNLLVTINGYSEMGLQEVDPESRLEDYFQEILRSGKRAASLTQQLLAYSRKQLVQPRALDINDAVRDMEKMLRRLIGENLAVETALSDGLPYVKADPGQLEQIILNLVVNARDAMPDGGELVLATGWSRLDEDRLQGNPEAKPGIFVHLVVSDTGTGMPPEVMERVFEPFFTTKPVGKGTGLGLASVYGIVKQGGGHIEVESEPGSGSKFSIFLPIAEDADPAHEGEEESRPSSRNTGTLLLVEDEESVRTFTRLVLENRGYRVHTAADGSEAMRIAGTLPELQLLLTDVVMPGMRGTALVDEIRKLHPEVKVLLMSGYLEEAIVHPDKAGEGRIFLQKPFRIEQLSAMVEAILELG